MIPALFTHVPVTTVKEASDALKHYGDDAKLLAGGHSLIPLMKLRLATPGVLIDIARISDLRGIREDKDKLVVGALTTHEQIENSPLINKYAPLIGAALLWRFRWTTHQRTISPTNSWVIGLYSRGNSNGRSDIYSGCQDITDFDSWDE